MRATERWNALGVLIFAASAAAAAAQESAAESRPGLFGFVVADESGDGLGGARVEAYASARRGSQGVAAPAQPDPTAAVAGPFAKTTTDERGGFTLALPPGTWFVRAIFPGRATSFQQAETPRADAFMFRLGTGTAVAGSVALPDGKAAVGAVVTMLGAETKTDPNGAFVLSDLSPTEESPTLLVRLPGFAAEELRPEWPPEGPITVALRDGAVLDVLVAGENDAPLAGVKLVARLVHAAPFSELERADFTATTGAEGSVRIVDLPPATPIVVHAMLDGYVSSVSVPTLSRDARLRDYRPLRLRLVKGLSAMFAVSDPDGAAAKDVVVRIRTPVEWRRDFRGALPPEGTAESTARDIPVPADGKVRVDLLPADLLTAEFRAPGFLPRLIVFRAAAEPAAIAVRLTRATDLSAAVPWRKTLDDAFREAYAKQVPVFVSVGMDDEVSNDTLRVRHFHDPEIVRTLGVMAPVIASAFGPPNPGDVHVEKDGICAHYGGCSCAAHQYTEQWVVDEFFGGLRNFTVPRQIVVAPSGEVLEHRPYMLSETALARLALRSLRRTNLPLAVGLATERMPEAAAALKAGDQSMRADLAVLANAGDEAAVALLFDGGGLVAAVDAGLMREAIVGFPPQIAELPAPTREQLLAAAAAPRGFDAVLALRALRRLCGGDIGSDDEIFEFFLGRRQDDDDLVREEVVDSLGLCPGTANDVLRAAAGDPVLEVRIAAALGLAARAEDTGRDVLEAAKDHAEYGPRIRAALK